MGDEAQREVHHVKDAKWEEYVAVLKEFSRPPSRGGNTRANHQHRMKIDGQWYSWLGLGSKKWVYKSDTVSFAWSFDPSGQYRNVDADSIQATDTNGNSITRGERGTKKWRTAPTRAPVSRREWRD